MEVATLVVVAVAVAAVANSHPSPLINDVHS